MGAREILRTVGLMLASFSLGMGVTNIIYASQLCRSSKPWASGRRSAKDKGRNKGEQSDNC